MADQQPAPPTQQIPTPHPDLQRPPTGPPPIQMDPVLYQAWETERLDLIKFKATAMKEFEAKEAERLQALAKAGELEKAWAENDKRWEAKDREKEQRYQSLETAWLTEKKTAEIAAALNGRSFAGQDPAKTAALVRRLLAEEIEAARDSQGNPSVYDRTTRRPAADYLKERLESPEFSVFFAPNQRGGSGTDGTRTAGGFQQQSNDPIGDYMKKMREQRELAVSDPSRVF